MNLTSPETAERQPRNRVLWLTTWEINCADESDVAVAVPPSPDLQVIPADPVIKLFQFLRALLMPPPEREHRGMRDGGLLHVRQVP